MNDDSTQEIVRQFKLSQNLFREAIEMLIAGAESGGWIVAKVAGGKQVVSAGSKGFELGAGALNTFIERGLATSGGTNSRGEERYSPTQKAREVAALLKS